MFAGAMFAACVMVAALVRHRAAGVPTKQPVAVVAHTVTPASPRALPPVYRSAAAVQRIRILHAPLNRTRLVSFPAPEAPLTEQEKLLVAVAQSPRVLAGLRSVATSETVVDHGLGKNAILELDHEELAQLKTTLQPALLKNTLPQPNHPGDIE
jgi:hypothetical protein